MGPSWSPDGNSIVFTSGGVIHFVSLDGLQPRVLQLPSSIGSPRMSRTGALVFHSTADGNTRFRSDAGLVPDGERIAFGSQRDGFHSIYVMKSDGTEQRCVAGCSTP